MADERLEQEVALLHEKICQGIGDVKRILILYALARNPRCVNELVEELEMPQSTVSRHLKILRERTLVNTERHGAQIIYSIADMRLIKALDLMRAVLADLLRDQAAVLNDDID